MGPTGKAPQHAYGLLPILRFAKDATLISDNRISSNNQGIWCHRSRNFPPFASGIFTNQGLWRKGFRHFLHIAVHHKWIHADLHKKILAPRGL